MPALPLAYRRLSHLDIKNIIITINNMMRMRGGAGAGQRRALLSRVTSLASTATGRHCAAAPPCQPVGRPLVMVMMMMMPPQVRFHMSSHGGGSHNGVTHHDEPVAPGPRLPCALGLDAAAATQNILRLLESASTAESRETTWHAQALTWEYDDNDNNNKNENDAGGWTATTPFAQGYSHPPRSSLSATTPKLLSLHLSDNRTALVKLQGVGGGKDDDRLRYVSLLRLEEERPAHDGWRIVRQAVSLPPATRPSTASSSPSSQSAAALVSLTRALEAYLRVEHGGGVDDATRADRLLAPQASLLTVGTAGRDDPSSPWSAAAGRYLEIARATYLDGVRRQRPHDDDAAVHDAVVAVEVLPCRTLAAATVRVGNGAQTAVFVDHLLWGRRRRRMQDDIKDNDDDDVELFDDWQILSKVFSTQPWPTTT